MHNDPPFSRGPLPDDDDDQTLRDGDVNHALPLHEVEDDDQTLRDGDVNRSRLTGWEPAIGGQDSSRPIEPPAAPGITDGESSPRTDEPVARPPGGGTVIFTPPTPLPAPVEDFPTPVAAAFTRDVVGASKPAEVTPPPVEDSESPASAALSPAPEAASLAAARAALSAAEVSQPPAFTPAPVEVASGAEPARRGGGKGILLAGVAAIVLILGVAGFFFLNNKPADNEAAPRQAAQAAVPAQSAVASPAVAASASSPVAAAPTRQQPASLTDPSILYQANWTQGLAGWPSTNGWSATDGVLKNDGSDFGDGNWMGGLWNVHGVAAPFSPPAEVDTYAVEAEIQVPNRPACGSFGLAARGTQQVGIHMCGVDGATVLSIRSSTPELLLDTPITVNEGWHLYRVEVHPDITVVMIDGVRVAEVSDASAPATGPAGLWDDHTPIQVRQFQLRKL